MLTLFKGIRFLALVSGFSLTSAQAVFAGEAAGLLAGAETYSLTVSVFTEAGCDIDQQAAKARAASLFGRAPKLRAVAEQSIPDIMLRVTVDVAALPPGAPAPEFCMYVVNARAIHPMYGKLRYADKPRAIQALTFNKSVYSVIVPSKAQEAVETQIAKALGFFFDEYQAGNPYP